MTKLQQERCKIILQNENDIEILEKNFSHLKFKNIRNEIPQWEMKEIYEHELDLRGNFAAASDLFRLYVGKNLGSVCRCRSSPYNDTYL